jgi:hypothetical protein
LCVEAVSKGQCTYSLNPYASEGQKTESDIAVQTADAVRQNILGLIVEVKKSIDP